MQRAVWDDKTWQSKSSRFWTKGRSPALGEIDQALAAFNVIKNDDNINTDQKEAYLVDIAEAILRWETSQKRQVSGGSTRLIGI